MTTLTALNGARILVDPSKVRQVLGVGGAQVYLTTGIDVPVHEKREEALDRLTAPKRRKK